MEITKNMPVTFLGQKYRVVRIIGRDIEIGDVEGHRFIVHPLNVQIGWDN